MPRILSMLQFCVWYGLGRKTIRNMLRAGDLQGIRTPVGWRIVDPSRELFEILRRRAIEIDQACFLRGIEVAELLGMSTRRVRRLAEDGRLRFRMIGKRRAYPLASVVGFIAQRERGAKRGTGSYSRPTVMAWARKRLERQRTEP